MKKKVFWLKQRNFGRLHICIGRNWFLDSLPKKLSISMSVENGMVFSTFRLKTRFINIDWV